MKDKVLYTRQLNSIHENHKPDGAMSENIHELSEDELARLIGNAQKSLRDRQAAKRKQAVAQIKELAASIGYSAELTDISPGQASGSARKGIKVAIKYRDPDNPRHQWTGRGMQPTWLRELLGQGRSLDEFSVA